MLEPIALVLHHYWNNPGGGQLVSAAVAVSLSSLGYRVYLVSPVRIDASRYMEWFGIDLERFPRIDGRLRLRAFGLYLRLLVGHAGRRAVEKLGRVDIVFVDEPTYAAMLDAVWEAGARVVEYIHFPYEAILNPPPGYPGVADVYYREVYRGWRSLYFRVWLMLYPRFARSNPFAAADVVLANSRWTARLCREVYGEEPIVLNPPLPPSTEVVVNPRGFGERRPIVAMVGRFTPEKRIHWVVEHVYPLLKREVSDARLVVAGSAATRSLRRYYMRVWRLAERLGYRVSDRLDADADIYLIPTPPRRIINRVLDTARAYLHAAVNEHWGITVAEAMARGTPVVVHESGGAWTDLAQEGVSGLGYETAEEAADTLARLLTDERLFTTMQRAAVERVRSLTLDSFAARLAEVISR